MKYGYILLSAIGVLVLLGVVGAFVLKEAATSSAAKSAQLAKTKVELVLLASEAIVLNEVVGHNFYQSCLDKFNKSFSNGEINAHYELIYSDNLGLCRGAFIRQANGFVKELRIAVKAVVSTKAQGVLIRQVKIFNLKI